MNFGFIYKITNTINGKSYIGQTQLSIEHRWIQHKSSAKCNSMHPIHRAIRKYGVNSFIIEEIIKCPIDDLNQMEEYYISKYDTFYNGYNATSGGHFGTTNKRYTDDDVLVLYNKLQHVGKVAEQLGSNQNTISTILHKHNVDVIQHAPPRNYRPVKIVELDKQFNSMTECGEWLISNGYSKASQPVEAMKSIQRVLRGERKTYCKFHFIEIEKLRGELLL